MDEDFLTRKLQSLETQKEQGIANVNAISGAIQLAKELLAEMRKPAESEAHPPEVPERTKAPAD